MNIIFDGNCVINLREPQPHYKRPNNLNQSRQIVRQGGSKETKDKTSRRAWFIFSILATPILLTGMAFGTTAFFIGGVAAIPVVVASAVVGGAMGLALLGLRAIAVDAVASDAIAINSEPSQLVVSYYSEIFKDQST